MQLLATKLNLICQAYGAAVLKLGVTTQIGVAGRLQWHWQLEKKRKKR